MSEGTKHSCPSCHGRGELRSFSSGLYPGYDYNICPECRGRGWLSRYQLAQYIRKYPSGKYSNTNALSEIIPMV